MIVISAVIASVPALSAGEQANAVVGSDFRPGNIISDSLFYDPGAMSQAEIQSFLNGTVGSCQNGMCLNVLVTSVTGRPRLVSQTTGNLVCEAFDGGTISAAAIIYRAQVACGISAKVILVTLQKEQGLLTAVAPSTSALARAMGMACPDTAPCADYALGFGNQIYEGVRQLKIYKAGNFGKQPGVTSVAFHPNAACGSSTVTIENYATAALYNYTPYQPNAAALANFGGPGDDCSSYGNRNFWKFYNDWFGSTQAPADFVTGASAYLMTVDAAGSLVIFPGNGKGSWLSAQKVGDGWTGMTRVFGAGDFDGDGNRDVLAIDSAGVLWDYPLDGRTTVLSPKRVSDGWSAATAVFSPGDFSGDGYPDVMSRDAAGDLWLYRGTGRGGLEPPVKVGNGWSGLDQIFSPGDFTGDSKPDLLARDASGFLWLYPGNGHGGWLGSPARIGNGWGGLSALAGPGDFNGDGTADVTARDAAGYLLLFPGNGRAGWLNATRIGQGWSGMRVISGPGPAAGLLAADQAGVGDLNSDGARDVLATDSLGNLLLYPGNGAGSWLAPSRVAADWGTTNSIVGVGDVTGDYLADVVSKDSQGLLWLYPGNGRSGFGQRVQIGSGWQGMDLIIGAGDVDGDRIADILSRGTDGTLWLYPGTGGGNLGVPRAVGNGWSGLTAVLNAGDVDSDGKQDLVARDASGRLLLYAGNGAGGWRSPVQIGTGWGGMTAILSPGDFTGDRIPDILARDGSGRLVLYRGDGSGGFGAGAVIGWGWQSMVAIN